MTEQEKAIIADEIAAAVAAERARCAGIARRYANEYGDEAAHGAYNEGAAECAEEIADAITDADAINPADKAPYWPPLLYRGKPVTDWRDVPEWNTPPSPDKAIADAARAYVEHLGAPYSREWHDNSLRLLKVLIEAVEAAKAAS